MGYKTTIDKYSGFCGGVIRAIERAEQLVDAGETLYSLGAVVHNNEELLRLGKKGLKVITKDRLNELPRGTKVLIRAHGEPLSTYELASKKELELIECTCPVVLQLQKKIRKEYARIHPMGGQIIIFGKPGHAEVDGLTGQVSGNAIVLDHIEDLNGVIFPDGPVSVFSQTTKNPSEYENLCREIRRRIVRQDGDDKRLTVFNTICKQVSGRQARLEAFASAHSIILFISGKESSNGKVLYHICKSVNERSYFIENELDINPEWFRPGDSVGICGATSTPAWLMQAIARNVEQLP
ncbi:MAG: 4-hydroxy-3-methylbut-2-enyl diphosphate reductase [Bacteroidales bacterium]|jgi:4-hydroxy-3-methylbut-2-enyl diphosphate reductase